MRKLSFSLIYFIASILCFFALHNYLSVQDKEFNQATQIIKAKALQQMFKANSEGNHQAYRFYRYYYLNPEIVVSELGASNILKREKSR